ncbi:hypothetical protein ACWEKR_29640 [Nocardia sp. NPDC004573]
MLCGVWALLTATRLTRGEEDAGHWDLLLGGRLRRVDLVARCAATLWLAATVIGGHPDAAERSHATLEFAGPH